MSGMFRIVHCVIVGAKCMDGLNRQFVYSGSSKLCSMNLFCMQDV